MVRLALNLKKESQIGANFFVPIANSVLSVPDFQNIIKVWAKMIRRSLSWIHL